ncbi:MAG: 4a-hydroxytetrahydrobiopterin dehydratase [Alphaproteobacteria bacterium]|nr:4a-hydroxytetrahydrobiopterin dehydratase [Alphaproteobacteria bacterium]
MQVGHVDLEPLSQDLLTDWLETTDVWRVSGTEIVGDFTFKNFSQALGFIVQVGILAERQDHHPRIENTYTRVTIAMNTHDAGNKITRRDTKLAELIEQINIY